MMLLSKSQFKRTNKALMGIAWFLLLSSTSWAQQLATGETKLPNRPAGAITGRVVTSAGEPLQGAIVYAGTPGGVTQFQTAKADSNGEFKVEGLEAGLYRVWASVPGHISVPQPTGSEPVYYHTGDVVTLIMIKGAVITGKVTGPNGPAVATNVRAIRVRDDEGKPLLAPIVLRERFTDDRGVYRIYGLSSGTYMIAAGGPPRFAGGNVPTAFDNDGPTYFPSSTRDTASEVIARNGEEVTADIQYRSEPGHSISGTVAGLAQSQMSISATISLTDVGNRSAIMNATTSSYNKYAFAFYGVPDGEYELSSSQFLPSSDVLRSEPRRVKVRGADVIGAALVLVPLASIEGRLLLENDPKAGCAKRRETAAQETIIFARRYETEKKTGANSRTPPSPEVSISATNHVGESVANAKGNFVFRNLPNGSYRIDPRAPASGWYIRSIAIEPAPTAVRNPGLAVARDGIALKPGERVSGLTVTITEGAAGLRGRVSVAEGQALPSGLRVYLAPAERESGDNVLRFFEARADADGSFAMGNIAPGRYWIIARADPDGDPAKIKSIRRDAELRAKVLREAEALKKDVSFKPCERTIDYDLRYPLTAAPPTQ